MLELNNLHEQNHELSEIARVLPFLAQNRALCDTATASRLFFGAAQKVEMHLKEVDQPVKQLFTDQDERVRNLARKLSADSKLLQFNVNSYVKRWSDARGMRLRIREHEAFLTETQGLFELLLDRIQRETELLFPLLRELEAREIRAA